MTLRRACLLATLLILSSLTAFGGDWLMGRYDPTQTSCTTDKLQLPLVLSWEFVGSRCDNNPAAPMVVGGTVYFACSDRIYAIDLATGTQKWRYPSEQSLSGSIKGTPAYYNGAVYFGAGDENLYCIDAESGTFRWAYKVRGAIRCPPVIQDGVIYIGADDESLYALDAASGEHQWHFTARDDVAVGIAVGFEMAVVSSMDGNMYGVTTGTGRMRWTPFRLPVAPTDTSPVISDKAVIMAVGNSLYGLAIRSGQLRWHTTLESEAAATPAVQDFDVYVPCRNKKLYAYSTNGRKPVLKWTQPVDLGSMPMSSPIVAGDTVWVTTARGTVSAYSVADGSLKWRYVFTPSTVTAPNQTFCDASASPTVAGGALLVGTDDGVLHCFTPQAPDYEPPMAFAATPVNGTLMSGAPPIKISTVLYDMGSGVDFSTASITVDGQPVETKTDPITSTVSYQTEMGGDGKQATVLGDGVHRIIVSAKDYAGNVLSKEWYIVADATLPPPRRSAPTEEPGKKSREPGRNRSSRNTSSENPDGGQQSPPTPPSMDRETPPPPPPPPAAPGGTGGPGGPPSS